MRILVSNDDGYNSPGIRALAAALGQIATVRVVAPDHNNSAASNALTIYNPLRAYNMDEGVIAVSGTPADSVHLALTGLFDHEDAFDMVVSGINHGANLGEDVFYSGTVGAAMEGRLLRYPAIAVSMVTINPIHFDTACHVVLELIGKLRKSVDSGQFAANTILNVNVPDIPLAELKGIKICRCGKRLAAEPAIKQLDPRGRQTYWVGAAGQVDDDSEGTDFAAINAAYASVTPLLVDMTNSSLLAPLAACLL